MVFQSSKLKHLVEYYFKNMVYHSVKNILSMRMTFADTLKNLTFAP